MNVKTKIAAGVFVVLVSFASGRYSVPEKVKIEKQIVEVEKKTTDTQTRTDRDRHKKTDTVVVERPDGTKETHTVTTDDSDTTRNTDSKSQTDIAKSETDKKEVVKGSDKVSLSFLAGGKVSFGSSVPLTPVYGASITKPVLGPVTIGLWGLSNATGGASVGLTF